MTAGAAPRKRRGVLLPAVVVLGALAVLIGLGTWQLDRKSSKEALIAVLDARLNAPPTALPARANWPQLDAWRDEFNRVTFRAEFVPGAEALVYASGGSNLRPDVSGPGYWVFAPARLADGGTVIVNRGFVPEGRQRPETRAEGNVGGPVTITGNLRWPEARGIFTPADKADLFFTRDPAAMAAAKGWGEVAPFYVDQEAPLPPGGLPRAGPLKIKLPNNHLQYAVTWYGLALVLVAVAFFFWRSSRRSARSAT